MGTDNAWPSSTPRFPEQSRLHLTERRCVKLLAVKITGSTSYARCDYMHQGVTFHPLPHWRLTRHWAVSQPLAANAIQGLTNEYRTFIYRVIFSHGPRFLVRFLLSEDFRTFCLRLTRMEYYFMAFQRVLSSTRSINSAFADVLVAAACRQYH